MSGKKRCPVLKWFVRTVGVLALVLVIAASWAAWRMFGPLPPMPDYHARLTSLAESRLTSEQLASNEPCKWDLYVQGLRRIADAGLAYHVQEYGPLKGAGSPDFGFRDPVPDVAVALMDPESSVMLDAMRKLEECGFFERVDRIPGAPPSVRQRMEDRALMQDIGWDMGASRGLLAILLGEFRYSMRIRDFDRAAIAAERCMAIASVHSTDLLLVPVLMSVSNRIWVYATIREEIVFGSDWPPHFLARLERALDIAPDTFDVELAFSAEFIQLRDTLDRNLRGMLPEETGARDPIEMRLLRILVNPQELLDAYDEVVADLVGIGDLDSDEAVAHMRWVRGRLRRGHYFNRVTIPLSVVDSMAKSFRSRDDVESLYDGTRLMLAIERYRLDHDGAPPAAFDALVPEYLDEVPIDPLSDAGGAFGYRLVTAFDPDPLVSPKGRMLSDEFLPIPPRTYLLWSAGRDHVDDGGDPEHDYILNNPPRRPEPPKNIEASEVAP
ncbi:MAG: hypothetical protein AAGD00_01560 [Planctomycetota bacterium]